MTRMTDDRLMLMYHSRARLLLHTLSPRERAARRDACSFREHRDAPVRVLLCRGRAQSDLAIPRAETIVKHVKTHRKRAGK
jgi:hypothetical protein